MQSILQWNCRGLRSSTPELQALIRSQRPRVACIQETKLRPEFRLAIKGFSVFRKDLAVDTIAHGGVMILVLNTVPVRRVELRSPLQAVVVRIPI